MLITGSNASGKSTFVKAVALNAILAQSICTCWAETFSMPRAQVMSSMALRDDVQGGDSYFIVEIKSLKRLSRPCGKTVSRCALSMKFFAEPTPWSESRLPRRCFGIWTGKTRCALPRRTIWSLRSCCQSIVRYISGRRSHRRAWYSRIRLRKAFPQRETRFGFWSSTRFRRRS